MDTIASKVASTAARHLAALTLALAASTHAAFAADFEVSTHHYATNDGAELYLDVIVDPEADFNEARPVILYSFGGGWETGGRGDLGEMWEHFLSLGYAIVAIDYRLGVKIAKERGEFNDENGTEMYLQAIEWSVQDIFDATSFIVERASDWNLATDQITLLGGSSGATNSLVAEYNVANATQLALENLPENFRYAGVISMAGAFWLPEGTPLEFATKPAPIMFFHGAQDWLVTYDEVQDGFSGYGPNFYFREFAGAEYPKWFFDYPDGDHVIAALPLMTRQLEMQAFLERMVRDGQELSVHTIETSRYPSSFLGLVEQSADQPEVPD